jgi:hypothetical protein
MSPTLKTEAGEAPNGRHGFASFTAGQPQRWSLQRSWGHLPGWQDMPRRTMVWVCCNPSTAGAFVDDATVRRCLGYAERERCTALEMVNLTPQIATRPVHLHGLSPGEQDWWWAQVAVDAVTGGLEGLHWGPIRVQGGPETPPLVMLGWGAATDTRPWLAERARMLRRFLAEHNVRWHALGFTASGQPVHPLYQRSDAQLLERSSR